MYYVSLLQVIQIQIMGHERKHTPSSSPTHSISQTPHYILHRSKTVDSKSHLFLGEKNWNQFFLKEFLHVVVICNLCDSSSKLYFKNNLPFQICLQDWQVAKCKKQQHQRGFMNWKIVQLTCFYNVKLTKIAFFGFSPHSSFKEYCTNNTAKLIFLF